MYSTLRQEITQVVIISSDWPHVLNVFGLKYLYFAFKVCSLRKDWHVCANGMLLFAEMNEANRDKVTARTFPCKRLMMMSIHRHELDAWRVDRRYNYSRRMELMASHGWSYWLEETWFLSLYWTQWLPVCDCKHEGDTHERCTLTTWCFDKMNRICSACSARA